MKSNFVNAGKDKTSALEVCLYGFIQGVLDRMEGYTGIFSEIF